MAEEEERNQSKTKFSLQDLKPRVLIEIILTLMAG